MTGGGHLRAIANNRLDAKTPANERKIIDHDQHRGMVAQKATDPRRLLVDVDANERALRLRRDDLEVHWSRLRLRIGLKPWRRHVNCSTFLPAPHGARPADKK